MVSANFHALFLRFCVIFLVCANHLAFRTYVGAAMRLCIELGLHRKPRRNIPSVEGEMNKRRFWTAYFLDRDISIALGRPPSISDHDIDADVGYPCLMLFYPCCPSSNYCSCLSM